MELVLPKSGTYVVAVSGGVDSVALLDILRHQPDLKLVVAHFDHGIRDDSAVDRTLVQELAASFGLPFVYDRGELGAGASEAEAREARYKFLNRVRLASQAKALITAHHQDDVIETAIINMIRGSKRKGLTALNSREDVIRPLLSVSKQELIDYAKAQGLKWHDDSTNSDNKYLRNYVRHKIIPRLSRDDRKELLSHINDLSKINSKLDEELDLQLRTQASDGKLDRVWFNNLSHPIAREVIAAWLRSHGAAGFDSKTIERLVVAAKVTSPNKRHPVQSGIMMQVGKHDLALVGSER